MTRNDFELIARTVRGLADENDTPLALHWRAKVARAFADMAAGTNPLFNRARFLKACGVEGEG